MNKEALNKFLDKIEQVYKADWIRDDKTDIFMITFKDNIQCSTAELSDRKQVLVFADNH